MRKIRGGPGCVRGHEETRRVSYGDVLREIRKVDECDMEKFGTLDSSEKTIAILGDGWWPQTAVQEGVEYVTFQGYLFAINIVC